MELEKRINNLEVSVILIRDRINEMQDDINRLIDLVVELNKRIN